MKIQKAISISRYDLCFSGKKETLFNQINELIDWDKIEKLINADYTKGKVL